MCEGHFPLAVACDTLRPNTWSFGGGSGILTTLTRSRSQLGKVNAGMTLARTYNINSKEPLLFSGTLGNQKGDLKFHRYSLNSKSEKVGRLILSIY